MKNDVTIRILETESNKLGDLFGRLMGDLFHSLGYETSRFNIHKSGREIDLEANHRIEKRRVIAECKATKEAIGGDDVNKFVGSLDVEKRKAPEVETLGYFISLSGFKETAIEQEKEAGNNRAILRNSNQVVEELISGRIIVSPEKAMERAGRCASLEPAELVPDTCELLAHDLGWIWVVYFSRNKERTHFALIHADGEALALSLSVPIIGAAKLVGLDLQSLIYLSPPHGVTISSTNVALVQQKYSDYLNGECGEIQLEGLPADGEIGTRRPKLENLFVPLYLELIKNPSLAHQRESLGLDTDEDDRMPVGEVLADNSRIAILAAPGGGKSTLIKRLAIAYARPNGRSLVDDNLPDRTWLPLFIRCRQLGTLVKSPISDILRAIPQRAELSNDLAGVFIALVDRALQGGTALLLIDGLDEISDERTRLRFVNQLRTFLAVYPNISVVVTSREAGFRIVGGVLSSACTHYRLANFDDDDIKRLTLAWHKEVVGDKPEIRLQAEELAETICNSDRVKQLAQTPLLLTTLLLVKRWVGQLPTRRSVLYGKAIEVLLMTWNVEGHDPIDPNEAIPQLSFLAYTMMKEGVQVISLKRLREILTLAREQMPEVLAYASFNITDFIERVELRSSLLVLSGYGVDEGTLYPLYEFRHLTFQEYLAARAIVEGYYPDRNDRDTLLSVLEPYLSNVQWKEVIPLAGVLSGRKVQPLIQHLIKLSKPESVLEHTSTPNTRPQELLALCIIDEITIPPDLLKEALEWIARRLHDLPINPLRLSILKGKYGEVFSSVVREAYSTSNTDLFQLGEVLGEITVAQILYKKRQAYLQL
jgi:hypothetical protein